MKKMKLSSEILKAGRILAKLEQADVVKETGLSPSTVWRIENNDGSHNVSVGNTFLYKQFIENHGIIFEETEKGVSVTRVNKSH